MKLYPNIKLLISNGCLNVCSYNLLILFKDIFNINEKEFDFSQSLFIYSPYIYSFCIFSLLQLYCNTYWSN